MSDFDPKKTSKLIDYPGPPSGRKLLNCTNGVF